MAIKAPVKNLYEVVIVLKANISDEALDKNVTQVISAIKNYGGSVIKIDEPVYRKFTHRIKNTKDGFYVSILFNSSPEVPNTLKRTLTISDEILRYIVVRKENQK